MDGKIVYFPILPDREDLGSERSDFVREWVDKYLISAGVVTLEEEKANAYLVATGDSGFMKAVRTKYDKKKIFFGINCGTVGFLLNPIMEINMVPTDFSQISTISVKMIKALFKLKSGEVKDFLAFNDVFCGRNIADYVTFDISGELTGFPNRIVQGNGIIISTPQGSTGFILKALGSSSILPLDTNTWKIGGVATGPYPNDLVMPQKIIIKVKSRKPVNGYADGYAQEAEDIESVVIEPTDNKVSVAFLKNIDFEARRRDLAQKVERG